jgi:hypothetical protein
VAAHRLRNTALDNATAISTYSVKIGTTIPPYSRLISEQFTVKSFLRKVLCGTHSRASCSFSVFAPFALRYSPSQSASRCCIVKVWRSLLNPLKPNGNFMSHLRQQSVTLHFVFMGFVWFSLWTAIISLNSVNQLIFVMVYYWWGTDWILKYYLDELRLERVNILRTSFAPPKRKLMDVSNVCEETTWNTWACGRIILKWIVK